MGLYLQPTTPHLFLAHHHQSVFLSISTMGLRKLFNQERKVAGYQKCLWLTTLRQSPLVSNQTHRYHSIPPLPLPPTPPTPPLPLGTSPETEIPLIPYIPPQRTAQTRHDVHKPRRRASHVYAGSGHQSPPSQHRRLIMMQQQQTVPSPELTSCTRCGSHYKTHPTTSVHKSSYVSEPISEPPPADPYADPGLAEAFVLVCRLLIFVFCFAIGIFVTVVCGAVWILVKISTSIEAHDTAAPEEPGVTGEGITTQNSIFQPANLPVEAADWRVIAWAREQGFLQLQGQEPVPEQGGDRFLEFASNPGPEPQSLAHGAAREAWVMHTVCPHCYE